MNVHFVKFYTLQRKYSPVYEYFSLYLYILEFLSHTLTHTHSVIPEHAIPFLSCPVPSSPLLSSPVLFCSFHSHSFSALSSTQPNWGEALFDMNYVGTSLIAEDGHCLLHHPYTQSGGDVKRTFFNGMLSMHPWLRVLGYTVHKFGCFMSGLYIRGYEVNFLEYDIPVRSEFWAVHVYLTLEFFFCVYSGAAWLWFCQYFGSLWLNTFLVVSSHDFEELTPARPEDLAEEHREDWGVFQITNSFDFTMCGNRWLDVFLSAGLSPHRTHHLLPYQHSGFANLVSEPVLKEVVEEFGLEWSKPRNWWTERLPLIFSHYMLSPAKDPRTNKYVPYGLGDTRSWTTCLTYMLGGFAGIGAV